ncbi:unnamed protein product [Calypogeia fissa]
MSSIGLAITAKGISRGNSDEVAEVIKDDLWPNPSKYFNHEADDEEYDDDDEADDEDEDTVSVREREEKILMTMMKSQMRKMKMGTVNP